jgi:Lar family restriction alleviation protein
MEKLKPCSFCGSIKSVVLIETTEFVDKLYQVGCDAMKCGCGATSGLWDSEDEAIAAWNRRANDD